MTKGSTPSDRRSRRGYGRSRRGSRMISRSFSRRAARSSCCRSARSSLRAWSARRAARDRRLACRRARGIAARSARRAARDRRLACRRAKGSQPGQPGERREIGEMRAVRARGLAAGQPGERREIGDLRAVERERLQPGQPGERREIGDLRVGEREELQPGQPGERRRSATFVLSASSLCNWLNGASSRDGRATVEIEPADKRTPNRTRAAILPQIPIWRGAEGSGADENRTFVISLRRLEQ